MTTNGFFAFAPQTFASSKRMTSSPTCVFPAPGGPWITATLFVSALLTAAACDLSREPQPSLGQASSSKYVASPSQTRIRPGETRSPAAAAPPVNVGMFVILDSARTPPGPPPGGSSGPIDTLRNNKSRCTRPGNSFSQKPTPPSTSRSMTRLLSFRNSLDRTTAQTQVCSPNVVGSTIITSAPFISRPLRWPSDAFAHDAFAQGSRSPAHSKRWSKPLRCIMPRNAHVRYTSTSLDDSPFDTARGARLARDLGSPPLTNGSASPRRPRPRPARP